MMHEDNGERGSFYIEENGDRIAELAYTWRADHLISIDHTEVDERLEGKGIGSQLVERAVQFARETGVKYKLYCSFAQKVFERHKEYADVLVSE